MYQLTVSRTAMGEGCGRGEALVAKRLVWQLGLDSPVWLANAPPEQRVRYTCGRLEGPLSEVSKPKVNACLLFRAVASKHRIPNTWFLSVRPGAHRNTPGASRSVIDGYV